MKQDEAHILHAIHLEGDSKVATLLDLAFARIEELERESRRHTQVIGGLVEHEQVREEASTPEALVRRIDAAARNLRVKPVFADAINGFSMLVPSDPNG